MNHQHDNRNEVRFCSGCGARVRLQQAEGKQRPVCPQCGRVHFRDPKVAVGVLVVEAGKALLVRRRHEPLQGGWSLPAGFVDGGEDPRRAAERECSEETGYRVTTAELIDIVYGREHAAGADLMLVYRARLKAGEPRAGDDAAEVAFFAADELPELAFESTQRTMQRWAKGELTSVL